MTITRIKRKIKKNKIRAKDRKKRMKYLLSCSSLKNIDIESIKEEFKKKKRKIKKNKIRAKDRKKRMKYLLSCSSLKNIDIESIKEEFKKNIVK